MQLQGIMRVMGLFGAILALAIFTGTAQASSSRSSVAATAASTCGQSAAFSHRNSGARYLSSAEMSTVRQLHVKALTLYSRINFIKHHRLMTAPRYKYWWKVPDKKWRRLVRRSRTILRRTVPQLASLNRRINTLQQRAIQGYDGYVSPGEARCLGQSMAADWGWTSQNGQWQCLDELWGTLESGWRMNADNPHSDAFGIPQALPGSKMGPRWMSSVWVQIKWGLGYIKGKFQTPCGALSVRLSTGSY